MRKLPILTSALLLVLPGCVALDQSQYTVKVYTTQTYSPVEYRNHAITHPAAVIPPVVQQPVRGCSPFVPPPPLPMPKLPDKTQLDAALEAAIAAYVSDLRRVIRLERESATRALQQHLATCPE